MPGSLRHSTIIQYWSTLHRFLMFKSQQNVLPHRQIRYQPHAEPVGWNACHPQSTDLACAHADDLTAKQADIAMRDPAEAQYSLDQCVLSITCLLYTSDAADDLL